MAVRVGSTQVPMADSYSTAGAIDGRKGIIAETRLSRQGRLNSHVRRVQPFLVGIDAVGDEVGTVEAW